MPSYTSLNAYPHVEQLTVTSSWEEIIVPAGCNQVDVYAVTNPIKIDYRATPSVEAPIDANIWFTAYAKMGRVSDGDTSFHLRAATNTTVYLRFL